LVGFERLVEAEFTAPVRRPLRRASVRTVSRVIESFLIDFIAAVPPMPNGATCPIRTPS
jgi:hypothetical protein